MNDSVVSLLTTCMWTALEARQRWSYSPVLWFYCVKFPVTARWDQRSLSQSWEMVLRDGLEKMVAHPWAVVKLASYISSKLNTICRTDFRILEESMMLGVMVQHDEAW